MGEAVGSGRTGAPRCAVILESLLLGDWGGFPRPLPAPASTLRLHGAIWLLLPSSSLCGCPQYSFKPNFNCLAWLEGYQELCHLPGVLHAPGGVRGLRGKRETAHESPRATECPVDGIGAMVHSSFSSFGPTPPTFGVFLLLN